MLEDALQVVTIAHSGDRDGGEFPTTKHYVDRIREAFLDHESNELIRELSLAELQGTGASVRRFYVSAASGLVTGSVSWTLDAAAHSLVVVIVTPAMLSDVAVIEFVGTLAQSVDASNGRHNLVVLGTSEAVLAEFRKRSSGPIRDIQGMSLEHLGEYALRPVLAAILVLSRAHRMLFHDLGEGVKPCFFISHAKYDGLPLAQSLLHVLSSFPWLASFYDAKDIHPGDDFKEVIRGGVLGSMLLVLRSDIYDLRFWCRQEVMWAEVYDRPALLVDARTELVSRASILGFIGVPAVRIPDGNLTRVLIAGLREWVRIGILQRRFQILMSKTHACAILLSRTPTLVSLVQAIEKLKATGVDCNADVQVVYPEPPLESSYHDAAQLMIKSSFPTGEVISFRSFVAQIS